MNDGVISMVTGYRSLTDHGVQQVNVLPDRLRGLTFYPGLVDSIRFFAREVQTSDLPAIVLRLEHEVDFGLQELDPGEADGMSTTLTGVSI